MNSPTEKRFRLTQNGFIWEFPAWWVADHRAKYYEKLGDDYQEEFTYTLNSNLELSDWFFNNMDFEDLPGEMTLVATPEAKFTPHAKYDCDIIGG